MEKSTRFVTYENVEHTSTKLTDVQIPFPKSSSPHIGMTYISKNNRCLYCLYKSQKKENCDPNLFLQLLEFIKEFREKENVTSAINHFCGPSKTNRDAASASEVEKLNREYKLQIESLIHIHLKSGGKGAFVLHGFLIGQTFEIVWIDPFHTIHRCNYNFISTGLKISNRFPIYLKLQAKVANFNY